MSGNKEQIDYWSGQAGDVWVAQQTRLDSQLAPLGLAAMAALSPSRGEVIGDIGCGAGQTTQQLTERVAPDGRALGVDVSTPLLALAKKRFSTISFTEADAATHTFPEKLDAIFSRFGVMFFVDPVAAFTNLASQLRPGGRLAFVCWRAPAENPILTLPMEAAVKAGVPKPPSSDDPFAPGPFAFADKERTTGILEKAGFKDVSLAPHDERIGGNDLNGALELALHVGPFGRMLREAPQYRDVSIAAIREALAPFETGGMVMLPSATWIATARVGG
ncbi:MAG TPA: methyltransferase domain-containing protein [Kofleriaceae bacterium]|jgi:ubiquinone/menaquinone biosynthesis C-methylase UbiE